MDEKYDFLRKKNFVGWTLLFHFILIDPDPDQLTQRNADPHPWKQKH